MNEIGPGLETIGVDPQQLGENVAIAVVGVLVLFFIISPIIGGLMARHVGRRFGFSMITGSMLLTMSGVYGFLLLTLPKILPETIGFTQIVIVSAAVGFGVALALGVYVRWWIAPPGPSIYQREFEALDEEFPFEQRRREFMDRRLKNTGRRKT